MERMVESVDSLRLFEILCCRNETKPYFFQKKCCKVACRKDGENIFSRACCDRTRSNGFKGREGTFRLGIRKKFFTIRVVRPWHRLSREVVDAPSLETFKTRLDGALSNLIQLKMSLPMAGGVGLDGL